MLLLLLLLLLWRAGRCFLELLLRSRVAREGARVARVLCAWGGHAKDDRRVKLDAGCVVRRKTAAGHHRRKEQLAQPPKHGRPDLGSREMRG
jgi:hypothetical protein